MIKNYLLKIIRRVSKNANPQNAVKLILGILFILGLLTVGDYGISWDESDLRLAGIVSAVYVIKLISPQSQLIPISNSIPDFNFDLPNLVTSKYYGITYEIPSIIIEKLVAPLSLEDKDIYIIRHLLVYTIFLVSCFYLFKFAKFRFGNSYFSILPILLLILSPRIYADNFYNAKDSVFMSIYIISLFYGWQLILKERNLDASIFGIIVGLSAGVRIIGIATVLFVSIFYLLKFLNKKTSLKNFITNLTISILLALSTLFITWPYSWRNPFKTLYESITMVSKFPWGGNNFYLGNLIPAPETPWHYTFTWILVTTPIFILILFFLGILNLIKNLSSFNKNETNQIEVFYLLSFLFPIVGTIFSKSTLYDGWRHHYFTYPGFILLSAIGAHHIYNFRLQKSKKHQTLIKTTSIVAFLAFSIQTTTWMLNAHPLQNVYFNQFVREDPISRFDVDYWGLANRSALESIVKSYPDVEQRETIKIFEASATPILISTIMLDNSARNKIEIVKNIEDAEFVITNYRGVKDPFKQREDLAKWGEIFKEIKIDNRITVLTVFKRRI